MILEKHLWVWVCAIAGCTFYSRMSCRESLGSRQNLLSLQLIGMYLVLIFKLPNHVIEISEETKEILPYKLYKSFSFASFLFGWIGGRRGWGEQVEACLGDQSTLHFPSQSSLAVRFPEERIVKGLRAVYLSPIESYTFQNLHHFQISVFHASWSCLYQYTPYSVNFKTQDSYKTYKLNTNYMEFWLW